MRLINVQTLRMKEFFEPDIPPYVILSHRWQKDEITLQEYEQGDAPSSCSYHKIENLRRLAVEENIEWIWLDTCCIDKRNSTELSEAINSMFKWYARSQFCVAYLFDIESGVNDITTSSWWTRCWTLQELICPSRVCFYDRDWKYLGAKSDLRSQISTVTGIDEDTLSGSDPLRCSVAQRMSWAAGRNATRIEDEAYSLLGLFDISLPMLYGDGEKAFMTLQERIAQSSEDQSIFAWDIFLDEARRGPNPRSFQMGLNGLFARSPAAFAACGGVRLTDRKEANRDHAFAFIGLGIELRAPAKPYEMRTYACALECSRDNEGADTREVIILKELDDHEHYARICVGSKSVLTMPASDFASKEVGRPRRFRVRQLIRNAAANMDYGFQIRSLSLPDCDASEMRKTSIVSRNGSLSKWQSQPQMVYLPTLCSGTAGMLILPTPLVWRSWRHLKWIRLGFDADFSPFCVLGYKDPDAVKPVRRNGVVARDAGQDPLRAILSTLDTCDDTLVLDGDNGGTWKMKNNIYTKVCPERALRRLDGSRPAVCGFLAASLKFPSNLPPSLTRRILGMSALSGQSTLLERVI
ncbi:hypothetical protein H2200_008993 [Cladophialophora chaetospira]|uniref:Heterokaryon incompatibility domain-containing protein n=1 Tax=Cladophialophora chaetospira TaxID=386627 RepID=A0AA39CG89_9EURO|nr:hypothetical protein H2200_008993 [Cladophialophora chaetospira]